MAAPSTPARCGTAPPRVGERLARLRPVGASDPEIDAATPGVVIGLDGGCPCSRHRRPERNFEVIAGKVINLDGPQHRFAFARNGNSAGELADAIVSAGVRRSLPRPSDAHLIFMKIDLGAMARTFARSLAHSS